MHLFGGNKHSTEKCSKNIRKEKEQSRVAGDYVRQQTERPPQTCLDEDLWMI